MHIKIAKPKKQYNSKELIEIKSLDGKLIAYMDNVPKILISTFISEIRDETHLSRRYIAECYRKAVEIFQNQIIDEMNFEEYIATVHKVSGIPYISVKENVTQLIDNLYTIPDYITTQVPKGAEFLDSTKIKKGNIVWVPNGEVVSVIAAGNNPLTNNGWLEALASGYKVIIKPSVNEPFTAHRLVMSLLQSGLPENYILFLPGGHELVEELVLYSDFVIAYGSEQLVKKYENNRKVLMHGPGRSKLFWDRSYVLDNIDYTENVIIDSIISDGGMKCINTSGILYDSEHRVHMEELYNKLLSQTTKGYFDLNGKLPIFNKQKALELSEYLLSFIKEQKVEIISPYKKLYEEIDEKLCVMYPLIMHVKEMNEELLKFEMAFPAVWTYEKKVQDDCKLLQNSLVLRLLTHDQRISERFCYDNTVQKVIFGSEQLNVLKSVPHEGYTLSRLFEAKAIC